MKVTPSGWAIMVAVHHLTVNPLVYIPSFSLLPLDFRIHNSVLLGDNKKHLQSCSSGSVWFGDVCFPTGMKRSFIADLQTRLKVHISKHTCVNRRQNNHIIGLIPRSYFLTLCHRVRNVLRQVWMTVWGLCNWMQHIYSGLMKTMLSFRHSCPVLTLIVQAWLWSCISNPPAIPAAHTVDVY